MNIVICDDDERQIQLVQDICKNVCTSEDSIQKFVSSKELCEVIVSTRPQIDLFVLDIEMPEISGLNVKNMISSMYSDTNIVFLTSHQEVMQEAFGKQVIGFLQKDSDEKKIADIINTIRQESNVNDEIVVQDGQIEYTLKKSQIIIIQAEHIYTKVYFSFYHNNDELVSRSKTFRVSLAKWISLLGEDDFCRVGRNYIINFAYVNRIDENIVIETGQEVHIPVKKSREIKMAYNKFCAKSARRIM